MSLKKIYNKLISILKLPSYFAIGIIATIPLFRCFFKIPYVFCAVCPRKCVWGNLRKFMIPSFLIINLDNKKWCLRLCPYGFIQSLQMRLKFKKFRISRLFVNFKYLILLFVVFITIITIFGYIIEIPRFFFSGGYNFILITFILALIIICLAFLIPKFWCNYFCPIGSISDLFLKIKTKLFK